VTGRYERHLKLKGIGLSGQRKLQRSRVLIVGAGGLGSPVSLYLSGAGVGTIGMVDFDRVEESNLHRQVIYGTRDIGRKKLDAAIDRLSDLNPHVKFVAHPGKLDQDNAVKTLKGYDVVIDCTDNIPSRYLVSDAAYLCGVPDVYGAVNAYQGQATLFGYDRGPCYRCLYPSPPGSEMAPSRTGNAVLGVLPGIVGNIQALEAIKVLLGIGKTLSGRLLLIDGLSLQFRELKVTKDPQCCLCGPSATMTKPIGLEPLGSRQKPNLR
jgi:adenylyltransferase/sulfurtransferase